jgi:polyisoprenoid-binding protein YceI
MRIPCTIAVASMLAVSNARAAPYQIDGTHSMAIFQASHLGISHTYGRFNDISGSFEWDASSPAAARLSVTIRADSIDTNHEKRDQHLRNPDFFNAAQFPVIKFVSSSVTPQPDGTHAVTGILTLHGVSKEITVGLNVVGEGSDPWGGYRAGLHTTFTIDRTDFGMDYMAEGAPTDVGLTISLEGIRQ